MWKNKNNSIPLHRNIQSSNFVLQELDLLLYTIRTELQICSSQFYRNSRNNAFFFLNENISHIWSTVKKKNLTWINGTIPSLAMACNRRGAPVRLWRPAPHVEKNEPITITHGEGHASVPTTRFPLTASPNLREGVGEEKCQ